MSVADGLRMVRIVTGFMPWGGVDLRKRLAGDLNVRRVGGTHECFDDGDHFLRGGVPGYIVGHFLSPIKKPPGSGVAHFDFVVWLLLAVKGWFWLIANG